MADRIAGRRSVLDGLVLPVRAGAVSVTDTGSAARYIYRGDPSLISDAFGIAMPTAPMRAQVSGTRAALWLGPDEWLLLTAESEATTVAAAIVSALDGKPASLVDVSHRQVGLAVSGPRATILLNAGCPLDLDESEFPVGMCTRTILAKAEIVLWRTASDAFRIEVGRSFAPYVVSFLTEALHGVD
jgi:sarcosine oxidase subunit gamma